MCTASSKYSRSLINSLVLDWKVHPFAKSCISTVLMSLKSLHTFFLHLNLATGTHPRHTPVCTSQIKLEEFQEREWVNRQTAAASQIWAQDGNCPSSCPAHRDPEISKGEGVGKAIVELKGTALCIQGQANLTAVLVDRPEANLLYTPVPFMAMSSVLLKWTLISEFLGFSYQSSPDRFRAGEVNPSPLFHVPKIENAHSKDLKQLHITYCKLRIMHEKHIWPF